jgi:hypothetical protein
LKKGFFFKFFLLDLDGLREKIFVEIGGTESDYGITAKELGWRVVSIEKLFYLLLIFFKTKQKIKFNFKAKML